MEGDQANLHNETLLGDGIFLSPLQKKLFEFNTKVETYYLIPTILNLKKGCKLRLSSRGESGSGCGSLLLPGCTKAAAAEQTHRRRRWDDYAARNSIKCKPGSTVKLDDGQMYVCQ